MDSRPMRFGALSLLFLVMAICLSVLAALSFSTANATKAMADRQAAHTTESYAAQSVGQEWLSDMDALLSQAAMSSDPNAYIQDNLPEGLVFEDGTVSGRVDCGGGYTLDVTISVDENYHYQVTSWKMNATWAPDTSIGTLLGA